MDRVPQMMPIRSVGRKTATYLASAVLVAVLVIVASTLYIGVPAGISLPKGSTSATSLAGPQSLLVVQLTDPPQVPPATKSLNLTYSQLSMVVGEPAANGKMNLTSVNTNPAGGSATLNLLKLQNVSQTILSANLPNGSIIYSVTFTVSSIAINVNGTVSPVALATGGNTFSVTIAQPSSLSGTNVALLQLNPIVVGTPSGYQVVPSAVGVIKHSQGQGEEAVGSQHQLTQEDNSDLEGARGNVTADLTSLSVSGSTSTVTIQVKNTGNASVTLTAIGLHGNFTMTASACSTTTTTSSSETSTTTHGSSTHSQTQTQTQTHTQTETSSQNTHRECQLPEHMNEVVFVPVSATTSTTSSTTSGACTSGQMKLVNGGEDNGDKGFTLQAGECVNFTFSGTIAFGESPVTLIPSTAAGQNYDIHVIASRGANIQLSCTLPLGPTSCKVDQQGSDSGD